MSAPPFDLPIRLAPYAALAGSQMLHIRPPHRYASTPPSLTGFDPADPERARRFLALLARPHVDCPEEAVMLYRDAIVLDGKQVLGRDGTGVGDSFPLYAEPRHVAWQHDHLAHIAAGDLATLPEAGPPVVSIFCECAFNLGHLMAEMLPRLVLLAEMGLRQVRLLLPQEAEPLRGAVEFALHATGIGAEIIACPAGAAVRVPALHWVSPVARHEHRKFETMLRLMERLCAAAPRGDGPTHLYVARPASARRPVTNAAAVEQAAVAAGYTVVEPATLPFAAQIGLFAGATRILGPMGAALTLAAAMVPGGRMAMLDGGSCDSFFWDLACLRGLDFAWGFTAPVAAYDFGLLDRPVTVPPDLLAEMLEAA
jgi:capsular polysaccharide biosynthesis protein